MRTPTLALLGASLLVVTAGTVAYALDDADTVAPEEAVEEVATPIRDRDRDQVRDEDCEPVRDRVRDQVRDEDCDPVRDRDRSGHPDGETPQGEQVRTMTQQQTRTQAHEQPRDGAEVRDQHRYRSWNGAPEADEIE